MCRNKLVDKRSHSFVKKVENNVPPWFHGIRGLE